MASLETGRVSQQQAVSLKRLMAEFGVPPVKRASRTKRALVSVDLATADADTVAARVREEGLHSLSRQTRNCEAWAILALRILAMTGQLVPILRCAPIARYSFEFSMGLNRADLVCWHEDGGVSIIEAKGGDGTLTSVVSGIGQVTMYALLYLQGCTKPPAYLRKYVVAPVSEDQIALCVLTALNCNVQFVSLPAFGSLREHALAFGRSLSEA